LAYLKNFPFDTIKIDRYFIKDVETDEKSQAIVRAIVALAHGLDSPNASQFGPGG